MKKWEGHYCKICGEHKANEKFSGKGHAAHICKACHSLPVLRRNELQLLRKIENIEQNFFISKENKSLLKKYAKDERYPEASEYAKAAIEQFERRVADYDSDKELDEDIAVALSFSELDADLKEITVTIMREVIKEFINTEGYIPSDKDKTMLLSEICEEMSEQYNIDAYELDDQRTIVADAKMRVAFDNSLTIILDELCANDVMVKTYLETLTIAETERLIIRRFTLDDLTDLHKIMSKPEVMYAWEHSFSKNETRKWLKAQLKRYKNDGFGYFALMLKETGRLIGQAGLLKSELDDNAVTELGYIIDDTYWHNGYATESAKACIELAFNEFELTAVHCTIRPENTASIAVAERLGMVMEGQYDKEYNGQIMPHLIYTLRK